VHKKAFTEITGIKQTARANNKKKESEV